MNEEWRDGKRGEGEEPVGGKVPLHGTVMARALLLVPTPSFPSTERNTSSYKLDSLLCSEEGLTVLLWHTQLIQLFQFPLTDRL